MKKTHRSLYNKHLVVSWGATLWLLSFLERLAPPYGHVDQVPKPPQLALFNKKGMRFNSKLLPDV